LQLHILGKQINCIALPL